MGEDWNMKAFVAVTDKNSWGRAENAQEAILNALNQAPAGVKTIRLICSEHESPKTYELTYVHQDGLLVSIKGAKITEIGTFDIEAIAKKYHEVMDDLAMELGI